MAKTGDHVVLPFGTLVGVFSTGTVQVKIPTKDTGRPTEDFAIVEFDQAFLQFVTAPGVPTHPIAIPPGSPGSPTNPIVLPGEPSHPIVIPPPPGTHPDNTLPSAPGRPERPDNTLPSAPGHPDAGLPSTPGRPDNTLPPEGGTKPTPVPPATPKK
jgi:hypothetical protein